MKSRLDQVHKSTVYRTAIVCPQWDKLNYNYRDVSSFLAIYSSEDSQLQSFGELFVTIGPKLV